MQSLILLISLIEQYFLKQTEAKVVQPMQRSDEDDIGGFNQ